MNEHEINIKNLIALSYKFKEQIFKDSKIYCYINLITIINNNYYIGSATHNTIDTLEKFNNLDYILTSLYPQNINSTFTHFYSEIKNYILKRVEEYLNTDKDASNLINNLSFPENTYEIFTLNICLILFENAYSMLNIYSQNTKLSNLIKNNLSKYILDLCSYEMMNKISSIELSKTRFKKQYNIVEIDLKIFNYIYNNINNLINTLEEKYNITEIFCDSIIDVKTLQGYRGQPGQPFVIDSLTMLDINKDFTKKFNLIENNNSNNSNNSNNRLLHINDKGYNLINCDILITEFSNKNFIINANIVDKILIKLVISMLTLKLTENLLSNINTSEHEILQEEYKYYITFELLN